MTVVGRRLLVVGQEQGRQAIVKDRWLQAATWRRAEGHERFGVTVEERRFQRPRKALRLIGL
jgi:hypothetical protein